MCPRRQGLGLLCGPSTSPLGGSTVTRTRTVSAYDAAIGALVLFLTLWFLWTLTPILAALAVPSGHTAPRIWLGAVIATVLLLGASAYLRAPSLLWQVPMQALALAFLVVGLQVLILDWRSLSGRMAATSVGYLAAGAGCGWFMRKFQKQFLSPHKPPNNRWRGP